MPAEWEPHEATWIAWPHEKSDWPGKFAAIAWVYVEIVRHLDESELVCIVVNDRKSETQARKLLSQASIDLDRVEFFHIKTDRSWLRDSGPIFVKDKDGQVAMTDWKFNAWAKYKNWNADNALPGRIAKALGCKRIEARLNSRQVVLEGGSIDVNGDGLLVTTEECLLSDVQARNPGLSREELEQVFADYLGIRKVLWLGAGIAGDDTHGHIDDIARFVGPRTIVAATESDAKDENFVPLRENLSRLRSMTDQNGKRFEIVELPMPSPVYFGKQRLPASYANFYIANTCVLVPTFNDPRDRIGLGVLSDLFSDRAVVGIHSVDLVFGLGTLHCLTQQQPK
jgi:agmatine deiminase